MKIPKQKLKNKEINAKEIVKTLSEYKNEINTYGVKKIGLFGSFVKDKQHKKSDIDLLVEFNKPTLELLHKFNLM